MRARLVWAATWAGYLCGRAIDWRSWTDTGWYAITVGPALLTVTVLMVTANLTHK